jgi:hypothetical protein
MALDYQLAEAAADLAHRHAARLGKAIRDGADDQHPEAPLDAAPALPTAVHLVYEGSSREVTERVVTLLKAWRHNGFVYFSGRCHLRKAIRTFRADHVVELICLATGEVPSDPAQWIIGHALFEGDQDDYTPHALRLCRDELALLAYVGRADGFFDPDEVEIAVDYVMMSTDKEINRDKAAKYIRRLQPSLADLPDHVRALDRRDERWARLSRVMRRLIDADRVVSIEEQTAWSEIENLRDNGDPPIACSAHAAELLVTGSPMLDALQVPRHDIRTFIAGLFGERS